MRWKRLAVRAISELVAWEGKSVGVRPGFRILLYHAVGSRLADDSYGISIQPESFERHMKVLAQRPEVQTVDLFSTPPSTRPLRVAVTFDDGYKDNLYTAAPILLKFQIPFTVFVTTSFIQSGSPDYLAPAELRELGSLPGVNIGSHGATHQPLARCDDATLWRELYESRCDIENVIGKPVKAIAYPHGSANRRVRDVARKAGYSVGGCSRFDVNNQSRDPLLLCRCEVLAADSERVLLQKLKGAWDWYRWRAKDPAAL
ncbi:MAG: polysaccharide deacetylase family protein [Pyrinomonadaceae bacterium]